MADIRKPVESWQNGTKGKVVLRRYGDKGVLEDLLLTAGKVVHLSPEERRINQEIAASPAQDVFGNGTLVPVRLLDDEPDTAEIAANPNLMGEAEMRELFKAPWKTFDTRVNEVANVLTLERLQELAHEANATVRQLDVIQRRLAELVPPAFAEVVSPEPEQRPSR